MNLRLCTAASAVLTLLSGVNAGLAIKRTRPLAQPSCVNFTPFVYAGCFKDDGGPRTLLYSSNLDFKTMTVEKCVAFCKGNDYRYAGLEYYGECYCGATVSGAQIDESNCNLPCNGNKNESCGGNKFLSIYQDPTFPVLDPLSISDYKSLGCYMEGKNGRTLAWRQGDLSQTDLTVETCLSTCKAGGYAFAGLEFGRECYCGVVLGNGTLPLNSAECDMPCTGNGYEYCGGRSKLNLYVATDLESTEPCVSDQLGISSSSSSVPSSSSILSSVSRTSSSGLVTTSFISATSSSTSSSASRTSSSRRATTGYGYLSTSSSGSSSSSSIPSTVTSTSASISSSGTTSSSSTLSSVYSTSPSASLRFSLSGLSSSSSSSSSVYSVSSTASLMASSSTLSDSSSTLSSVYSISSSTSASISSSGSNGSSSALSSTFSTSTSASASSRVSSLDPKSSLSSLSPASSTIAPASSSSLSQEPSSSSASSTRTSSSPGVSSQSTFFTSTQSTASISSRTTSFKSRSTTVAPPNCGYGECDPYGYSGDTKTKAQTTPYRFSLSLYHIDLHPEPTPYRTTRRDY